MPKGYKLKPGQRLATRKEASNALQKAVNDRLNERLKEKLHNAADAALYPMHTASSIWGDIRAAGEGLACLGGHPRKILGMAWQALTDSYIDLQQHLGAGITGFIKNGEFDLKQFASSTLDTFFNVASQIASTSLGGIGGGSGGIISSLAGGLFGGAFAAGGPHE